MIAPDTAKRAGRNLRRERRRWDDVDEHSLALGCVNCVERETCGGMHKRQNHYSCLDDCCGDPQTCDTVCPRNRTTFIERLREIDGYDLKNIPRASTRPAPHLPPYIPLVYHGDRRGKPLKVEAAAIPFHKLYSRGERRLRYASRAEMAAAFTISPDAQLVLIGCGRDKPIEAWWGLSGARAEIIAALAKLGIELVTSPNYSLFTDQPRFDDMYNIKRIGIAWQEILAGGVPGALHVNARTARDYDRLAEFIQQRDEVTDVAFEFATGAAWPGRRPFHQKHLTDLAAVVGRPLNLIMVGGLPAIPTLASAFASLSFIDTSAFMKTLHRKRIVEGNDGKLKPISELTETGAPLDDLMARNVEVMRAYVERLINASRARRGEDRTAPQSEILGKRASVQVGPSSGSDSAPELPKRDRPNEIANSRLGS